MDFTDKIIIDWITVTFKERDYQDYLFKFFNFPVDEAQKTRNRNFDNGLYFMGISIMWNTDSGLVMLNCSGQGCRTLESLNRDCNVWHMLFDIIYDNLVCADKNNQYKVHVSRLDLAYDIFDNPLTIKKINSYISKGKYACLSSSFTNISSFDNFGTDITENCIYVGSPKSDRFLRIYDKALEQGITNHQWIRFEMQSRNDCAKSILLNIFQYDYDIGYVYKGILHDYLRFLTKSRFSVDPKHINRINTCRWWLKLLDNISKIKQIKLPGIDYNAATLYRYIKVQTSSSLKTFLKLNNNDYSKLQKIIDDAEINLKQSELLSKKLLLDKLAYPDTDPIQLNFNDLDDMNE